MTRYGRYRNRTEAYGNRGKLAEYIVQNSMEANRNVWNMLEVTLSYKAWAWLTPTLTHVVTLRTSDLWCRRRRDVTLELDPLLGRSNIGMRASRAESRQKAWDPDERRWAIKID